MQSSQPIQVTKIPEKSEKILDTLKSILIQSKSEPECESECELLFDMIFSDFIVAKRNKT